MKTLGAQVGAIELIVQSKVPADDNSNLAIHLKILALAASTAKAAFKENVPGGEAKPNVWSGGGLAADFSKRMDELAANTADLEKTAEGNPSDGRWQATERAHLQGLPRPVSRAEEEVTANRQPVAR